MLLLPFQAELDGLAATGEPLAIVPHAFLHDVPLEAARIGGRPLIDRVPVFEATSLPALLATLAAPPVDWSADAPTLGVGAVEGGPGAELPGARAELDHLATAEHAALLTGTAATPQALLLALRPAKRVEIALHGHRGGSGEAGWLQLAPDAAHDEDGRLDALRIAGTATSADLVFLSACETGAGEFQPGDEGHGVVDRAFLLAGAHAVISSRWAVDDAATRHLVEQFWDEVGRSGPLEALNRAQKDLRRRPRTARRSVNDAA